MGLLGNDKCQSSHVKQPQTQKLESGPIISPKVNNLNREFLALAWDTGVNNFLEN